LLQTDTHAHLIPGVDEGSRSLAETLIMARTLVELGVERVHLTPHQFRFGNDLRNEEIRERTAEVRQYLREAGLDLDLVPGAEYLFGERLLDALERSEELMTWADVTPEGAADCVLVELPLREPVIGVRRASALFQVRGLQPVMAHPERVQALAALPRRILTWRDAGWRFQLDLLSLVGTYGRKPREMAHLFLEEGLYDFVGSDLHRSVQTMPLIRAHAVYRRARPARNAS